MPESGAQEGLALREESWRMKSEMECMKAAHALFKQTLVDQPGEAIAAHHNGAGAGKGGGDWLMRRGRRAGRKRLCRMGCWRRWLTRV